MSRKLDVTLKDMILLELAPRQHATIIAALRAYQAVGFSQDDCPAPIRSLATHGGTLEPLSYDEIDELVAAIK